MACGGTCLLLQMQCSTPWLVNHMQQQGMAWLTCHWQRRIIGGQWLEGYRRLWTAYEYRHGVCYSRALRRKWAKTCCTVSEYNDPIHWSCLLTVSLTYIHRRFQLVPSAWQTRYGQLRETIAWQQVKGFACTYRRWFSCRFLIPVCVFRHVPCPGAVVPIYALQIRHSPQSSPQCPKTQRPIGECVAVLVNILKCTCGVSKTKNRVVSTTGQNLSKNAANSTDKSLETEGFEPPAFRKHSKQCKANVIPLHHIPVCCWSCPDCFG